MNKKILIGIGIAFVLIVGFYLNKSIQLNGALEDYEDKVKECMEKSGINDSVILLDRDGNYQGYKLYELTIVSDSVSSMNTARIENVLTDIDNMSVSYKLKTLIIFEGVYDHSFKNFYDLDVLDGSLHLNGVKVTSSDRINSTTTSSATSNSTNELDRIKEFSKREWGDDSDMVSYEYNKQVSSYNYFLGLPESKVKEYALLEWIDGHGYTDWSMVEYEYDKQVSSYNYMQGVSDGQSAINKWTENGYTDWSMVEYEYRK